MSDSDSQQGAGLLRSSAVVAAMTMLSRVLGLVRDVVIAFYVGASANADAFFVAFKIPNFLRRLFAEGAFAQAFVPVLAETREQGGLVAVRQLVDRVACALGGTLLLLTVVAVAAAPALTALFAPGFFDDDAKFALTTDLIRLTFPYLFFISLTGLAGAILNSYGRFAVPAVTPVWLNLCLIGAALLGSDWFPDPAWALAAGVLLAGVVQFSFQIPFLYRLQLLPTPVWDWKHPGLRKVLALMAPALFGVSVNQINLLLDTVLASFLPDGSISWLYYSDRLIELPLGVFAIAIATVILPSLSRQRAAETRAAFSATLDWALRLVVMVAVPAAAALITLAAPILVTLFLYGEFATSDVLMARLSLWAYSLGLAGFMLVKVLAPGYFARQDMRTPVRIGIRAMVANMVLNLVLVVPLHMLFERGHVGLALATAISASLHAWWLFRGLRRDENFSPAPHWGRHLARVAVATLAMVALLLAVAPELTAWIDWTWWQRAWRLLALCGAGLAVYGIALVLMGVRLKHFRGYSTGL